MPFRTLHTFLFYLYFIILSLFIFRMDSYFLYQSLHFWPFESAQVAKSGYSMSILRLSVAGVKFNIGISIAKGYSPSRLM